MEHMEGCPSQPGPNGEVRDFCVCGGRETKTEDVHYRVIADDELRLLTPLFEKLGWPIPNPDMAKAVVAEAGQGKDALVIGFGVVEFICHVGAMWIHPGMRGTGIAENLCENVMSYIEKDCSIKKYVCLAKPGSFSARLAEKYGMTRAPADAFIKQL